METRADTFLSIVDRTARKLGPLNTLLASVVERVAPQTVARGCAPPIPATYCFKQCKFTSACCYTDINEWEMIEYWAPEFSSCRSGNYITCSDGCNTGSCPSCGG